MFKNICMRYFITMLNAALTEDDFNLLPEKQKRAVKTAAKLGVDRLDDEEQAEIENEYYADRSD
jgi:hypothetical protein